MSEQPAKTEATRVLLVDDHPIIRQGLAQIIDHEVDLSVCAAVASAAEAIDSVEQLSPDIAVVDLSLAGTSGLDLIRMMHTRWPQLPILVLSMHDETLQAERILRAGARGYVMKQEATETVLDAIRKVVRGGMYLSETMESRMLNKLVGTSPNESGSPLERLSDREFQIFEMLGRGELPRDIAPKLSLSVKTVEAHRERIKEKLKMKSSNELLRFAITYVMDVRHAKKPGAN
jgi:DNA-binding NarL/FixJ family response regulator